MSTNIIISDIAIHRDEQERYSLNDLHQASGGEEKDKPANWLRSDKTIELIDEILKAQIRAFKPVDARKGRYGGTYVCKELVYSYAMWISASFALKVIRAYDDIVSGQAYQVRKQNTVPGKLTIEQQEAIKQLVLTRGKSVPHEHQGKATITLWSALKSHFGCSYKEIPEENFTEALSLAARVPIDGEFIGRASSQNSLPAISGRIVLDYADGSVTRTEVVASNCFIGDVETLLEHLEKRGVVVLTNEDERRNFVKENLMRLIN
ncbi:KilA-N domain-containing protein [Candidatus Symbiopectobacterium sp.]|uniref:KilA-N domain-containing protein n=1 Tax=Candidatus Symbiopectobacterium sp. TaxID=2816440 RepID=UPI0025C29158|nr:KilA-N domain-containing protein [Candidatus Symbiopectobacterium sp.]